MEAAGASFIVNMTRMNIGCRQWADYNFTLSERSNLAEYRGGQVGGRPFLAVDLGVLPETWFFLCVIQIMQLNL